MRHVHQSVAAIHPRLEVRHLTPLVAIDRTGSVTLASELLGVTQSALSRRIQEAEQRLGTKLYHRQHKRLRLTAAGECLLENAKRILTALERAELDTIQMPAGPKHVVRVGAGAYASFDWLPGFLAALWRMAPSLDVVVTSESEGLPQDALLKNVIDVGIVPGPLDVKGIRAIRLFDDELVAILSPDHSLTRRKFLSADDFTDQTFVTYGPTYLVGFESDRVLRPAKVWPRKLIKVAYVNGIVSIVAAGLGISVLSRWAVMPAVRAGRIVTVGVTEAGLRIAWNVVVRRNDGEDTPALTVARELARWAGGTSRRFAV